VTSGQRNVRSRRSPPSTAENLDSCRRGGARLSHDHARQDVYVMQNLAIYRSMNFCMGRFCLSIPQGCFLLILPDHQTCPTSDRSLRSFAAHMGDPTCVPRTRRQNVTDLPYPPAHLQHISHLRTQYNSRALRNMVRSTGPTSTSSTIFSATRSMGAARTISITQGAALMGASQAHGIGACRSTQVSL
jgi:hypothetical protein